MLNKVEKEDYNYIKSLRLKSFRSHNDIIIEPDKSSVLIVGSNGVGKTSILEAISIFSYGKGIRNAKFYDMINIQKSSFLIDLQLYVRENFIIEYQTSFNKLNKTRKLIINNKESVILQAEDALLKLNNNASFLDITKTYNVDDDSKANKGYLGKLTLSDMTDVLKSNILDMKTSEIKIITSEYL